MITNPKILEVIVSTVQDALEAQAGGADRLEVVRNLENGGLTPDLELVEQIAQSVQIPIRVMLRENPSMKLESAAELEVLCRTAHRLNTLHLDGVVMGFIGHDDLDLATLEAISQAAPDLKVTFHRAFDDLSNPIRTILELKKLPRIDRILTIGGPGSWYSRKLRLQHWQRCAAPEITILAGAGLDPAIIKDLIQDQHIKEVHIGRAARVSQSTDGPVSREQVAHIKGLSA